MGRNFGFVMLNIEALKAIRKTSGDSQETLAARAGVSERALNFIEQGKTHARVSTIRKLADALSVPVAAITHAEDHQEAS